MSIKKDGKEMRGDALLKLIKDKPKGYVWNIGELFHALNNSLAKLWRIKNHKELRVSFHSIKHKYSLFVNKGKTRRYVFIKK